MDEITEVQAKKLAESKFWESMTQREIATFQLHTKRLCMPWEVFHEAVGVALGRPVYTHEFGLNAEGLRKELADEAPAPSFAEIVALIPEEARVIVALPAPEPRG